MKRCAPCVHFAKAFPDATDRTACFRKCECGCEVSDKEANHGHEFEVEGSIPPLALEKAFRACAEFEIAEYV